MIFKIKLPLFILLFSGLVFIYFSIGKPTDNIILNIRLPRLLLTLLTGFVLGGVGFTFQVLLNNPLADPYILGISSGAAVGSILAHILGFFILIPLFGFFGAFVTMLLVWKLANSGRFISSIKLLLAGIVVGMFFSACISLIMYLYQKDISGILNVLMGNLGKIFSVNEYQYFVVVMLVAISLMIILFSQSRKLIILTSGDEVATSLGVDTKLLRKQIFFIASILTGIVVAYAGIIGFIGLIVPHITRMMFGGNKTNGIVISSFLGAFILTFCDLIAMNIAVIEIPVGIITAFLGAPFFIFIMIKNS